MFDVQVPKITINTKSHKDYCKGENEIPSWRLGLRKTGSTSMVPHDSSVNKPNEDDKNLPRSASSPRLAEEKENKKNEKNVSCRVNNRILLCFPQCCVLDLLQFALVTMDGFNAITELTALVMGFNVILAVFITLTTSETKMRDLYNSLKLILQFAKYTNFCHFKPLLRNTYAMYHNAICLHRVYM